MSAQNPLPQLPDLSDSALLLIGFQNDYFSPDGILHGVVEASSKATGALKNTLALLGSYGEAFGTVVSTPIIFTRDYSELENPVGILKTIKEVGAFRADSPGSRTIDELKPYETLITEVPGKRGLCAFSNTELDAHLEAREIRRLVIAGTVTSLCIDSTARMAVERGYAVTILSDCTSGRTVFEQEFYCEQVFPLYSEVCSSAELVAHG